jgi:prepilin-type N-terminal cleavage/methylation domain-containing protein
MHINRKAFTLIELLVVVLIIGILAAIALPQYNAAVEKTKATEAIMLGKNLIDAADVYKLVNGDWPTSYDNLDIVIPKGYTVSGDKAKSNNFEIWLDGADAAVRIYRLNSSGQRVDYYFWWGMDSKLRTCNIHAGITNPLNDKGKRLCQSLGGVSTANGVWQF